MRKEETRQIDSVIFEGMTSINAVIKAYGASHSRRIEKVYFDKEKTSSKRREYAFLKESAKSLGFDLVLTDSESISSLALGNTHGGVIAECSSREILRLDSLDALPSDGFFVMIEGIEDPYNFGYAIRTLYAAGVSGIILPERNWMSAAGVVCRASAGASELVPSYVASAAYACERFKKEGYKVACAGIRDSISVFDADMKLPLLLVVGGEKRGISSAVLSLADIIVRIDYGREFKGSLSAASAASVLAYEVFRQNRK